MPEIEALALMNRIADPLAKVCIAQAALARRIFVNNKLFQVVKIEFFRVLTEVSQDIFYSDISVIIGVQT
jgi:hypothetical protein